MNSQRKAIAIAAGTGMFATFLPWANVPLIGSVNGTAGDGWITFILFGAVLALALTGNQKVRLAGRRMYGAIAAAGLAALLGIQKISDFNAVISEVDDNPFAEAFTSTFSIGVGLYVLILAGLAVIAAAYLIKDNEVSTRKGAKPPVAAKEDE